MRHIELVRELKAQGKGLMSENQYLGASEILELLSPCNFLVFGLGQDAFLWQEINKTGRTLFLEDDKDWIGQFSQSNLEIVSVDYTTESKDHESIGFDEKILEMKLPDSIRETRWDIIMVDGPLGHNPPRPYKGPGRMQSIFEASRLLKPGGICIVDDMGRLIERTYSLEYFGKNNIFHLIENKLGFFKKEIV